MKPRRYKEVYIEKYKALIEEIEEDTNKCKDILCSWIGRTLLKCPYYPNYRFNSNGIFIKIEQIILKFVWNHRKF